VVRTALDEVARPTVEEFSPEWVLVSCGFDAHQADPLAQLELSSGDFGELARVVREFAPRPGRLALFLEGGYNRAALQTSVVATLAPLLGLRHHPPAPTRGGPGMAQLREDRTERLRAIEQAYSG
jgi:acetoin utilization deacetylase AcuC-like enzyme